jgi:hypothetical protein
MCWFGFNGCVGGLDSSGESSRFQSRDGSSECMVDLGKLLLQR